MENDDKETILAALLVSFLLTFHIIEVQSIWSIQLKT